MGTLEDFERLDVPPDVKMLAFSLISRGPGQYHIVSTGRMLRVKHGKVANLGAKMRRVGLNASSDPAIIEIAPDCPFLEAFAPLRRGRALEEALPIEDDISSEAEETVVETPKKRGRPKKGSK
jgi:hypothetical protein